MYIIASVVQCLLVATHAGEAHWQSTTDVQPAQLCTLKSEPLVIMLTASCAMYSGAHVHVSSVLRQMSGHACFNTFLQVLHEAPDLNSSSAHTDSEEM